MTAWVLRIFWVNFSSLSFPCVNLPLVCINSHSTKTQVSGTQGLSWGSEASPKHSKGLELSPFLDWLDRLLKKLIHSQDSLLIRWSPVVHGSKLRCPRLWRCGIGSVLESPRFVILRAPPTRVPLAVDATEMEELNVCRIDALC